MQPIISRPQFATFVPETSLLFVSQASIQAGIVEALGLRSRVEPTIGCRNISKADMKFNDYMPKMSVDAEKYTVVADGMECKAEPAETLPMAQAYFIY